MADHDDISYGLLANRTLGELPISIATSLAVESILGINQLAPTAGGLMDSIGLLLVNIRTMVRNLVGSMESSDTVLLTYETITRSIITEMTVIDSLMKDKEVTYYIPTYREVETKFPLAKIRLNNTPKQAIYQALEQGVLRVLSEEKDNLSSNVIVIDTKLPGKLTKAAIITNYPIDLLSYSSYLNLTLVESHTGAFKNKLLWNSKFVNGRDADNIPFDKAMLQIFGDSVMFHPQGIKIRRRLLEIAEKFRWDPMTTKDRVLFSIRESHEPNLYAAVREFYNK